MTVRCHPCLLGLAIGVLAGLRLGAAGVAAGTNVTLQLAVSSGGTVSVSSRHACGPATTCVMPIAEGTGLTLKASPAPHFSFAGWSGACVGLAPQCFLSPVSSLGVHADFRPNAFI